MDVFPKGGPRDHSTLPPLPHQKKCIFNLKEIKGLKVKIEIEKLRCTRVVRVFLSQHEFDQVMKFVWKNLKYMTENLYTLHMTVFEIVKIDASVAMSHHQFSLF